MTTRHTGAPGASVDQLVETASLLLVGGGILTMTFAPLALPFIFLLAVAVLPVALVGAVVTAAVAALVLLVRGLTRVLGGTARRLQRRRARAAAPTETTSSADQPPTQPVAPALSATAGAVE